MLARSPRPERNEFRSPLVELPCPAGEVLADVDAVVVTHVHPDHFEEKTAALMDHMLPVYAQNETDAATIASWGFYRCTRTFRCRLVLWRAYAHARAGAAQPHACY